VSLLKKALDSEKFKVKNTDIEDVFENNKEDIIQMYKLSKSFLNVSDTLNEIARDEFTETKLRGGKIGLRSFNDEVVKAYLIRWGVVEK
jgi:hypothetical protein